MKKLLLIAALQVVSIYAWKWAHGDTSLSLVQLEFTNPCSRSSLLHGIPWMDCQDREIRSRWGIAGK